MRDRTQFCTKSPCRRCKKQKQLLWVLVNAIGGAILSMSATIIPLKIYFPKRGYQIGVAAKSLQHLRDTLQAKMGLSNTFKLTLDDGTIVCDPEYFKLLERQTKLNVIETSKTTTNGE